MNTHKTLLALCAATIMVVCEGLAQGSLMPPGPPEPTMRTLDQLEPRTPISSLPFEITQPGSYVLVRSLSGAAGGLAISASDVALDLNGFTLTGDRLVFGHGISVAAGCDNVTIRNGAVRSWGGNGVHASPALHVALDELWVEDCSGHGVTMCSGSIGHLTSQGNGGAGVFQSNPVPGIGIIVKKNPGGSSARLLQNGGGGLVLEGACDIEFSGQISGNTGHGVTWSSQTPNDALRVCLTTCDVSDNTGCGLYISENRHYAHVDCRFTDTTFDRNALEGVTIALSDPASRLAIVHRGGGACDNGGDGLNIVAGLGSNQGFFDIALSRNGGSGCNKVDAGASPGRMERVVACDNGDCGLAVEGGAWTLEDCTVADNVSHGIQSVMRTSHNGHITLIKFADCDVARNGGSGVTIAPDADGGPYKVAMQDMHVHDNGAGGLSYIGTCDASVEDASVSGNTGNGLAWASGGGGGTAGTPGATSFVRLVLRRCFSSSNTASGLHIAETGDVDADCDFTDCVFDRNGTDGVTLLLTDPASRLGIVHRGGGACDNMGYGLHLAAGRASKQGFFDIALSRNGASGCAKLDCEDSFGAFENVVAQKNGLHGLDLTGGTWSIGRCTVSDNIGGGVVYASRHVRLKHVSLLKMYDCAMERNGGDGLYVHTVEDDASYKVSMQDMHLRSNTGSGVRLSCDNALCSVELDALDCSASGNAGCGVKLIAPVAMDKGLRFRKKGGDCDDNALGGIFVDDSVVVRSGVLIGCVLRDNGTTSSQAPGFRAPGGALRLEGCVASGNSGDGFLITRPQLSGSLDQSSLSFDGCDAVHNGLSGIVVAGFDATTRASVSVTGGKAYWNVALGIDLSSSTGARGRVHGVHLGDNGAHGLLSAAASLDVCDNQFTGNVGSGLHVLSGAHRVARNVCSDNAVGVFLTAAGCTVLQNTFSGSGSGGALQVPIEDASGGGCDIAPFESASGRISPVANQSF